MTQLRQRMTDDMTVRGLAENTKKSYLNSVAGSHVTIVADPTGSPLRKSRTTSSICTNRRG